MNVSQNNDDVVNASVLGDLAANGQDAAGSSMPSIDLGVDGQSMVDQAPSEGSSLDSSNDSGGELDVTPGSGSAIEDSEENQGDQRPGEQAGDALMGDQDPGLMQEGKRVKVYELRDSSWYDRGTGYCKGVYDDTRDLALLIVEAEEQPEKGGEGEDGVGGSDEPGGFLKEELLLSSRVEKDDIYARQQDTLIVWTEPASQLDIALSFQDAEGCEDIWQFISEVQRHLNNMPTEAEQLAVPSSSSPMSQSPLLAGSVAQLPLGENRTAWEAPTLANIKQQEMWLRMQAKSAVGRERAVEHIISEDYIKQLIVVFEQAEDLESLDDLHALCSLMQTILMFNDNTILEYILQDDVFMGIIGMFEYDPDFPNLKASYRTFFSEIARFRQVVDIKAPNVRQKIHQLFRVQYLRDVVLARLLDDGTFGTLNGFVFFTQVDIITHIQTNDGVLTELLATFKDPASSPKAGQQSSQAEATIAGPDGQQIPLSEHKRDVVLFLNQLMVLGKGVQLPNRLQLYRNLLDRGLLFVCEWAFSRQEAQLLHAGAEILTLAVEHDINMVRMHVLKEEESKRRTLIFSILDLLHTTKNLGLLSQLGDSLRLILDTSAEENGFIPRKEGPVSENFTSYFHENCIATLFKPLTDLPEMKPADSTAKFPREKISLYHLLVELLSYQINNQAQASRTSYFILSTPISRQIVSLLYIKDKPLRHAALRFIKSCLRVPNHFIHRYFTKNHMFLPLLDLLSEESTRDNMLSSSCMEVLDLVRRENLKPIINHLFDQYRPRLEALAGRPFIKPYIAGLVTRYEQNNEPAPAPTQNAQAEAESSNAWKRNADAQEDDYFNTSDNEDDTIGPHQPSPTATATSSSPNASPQSKKRKPSPRESLRRQRPNAASPGKMIRGGAPSPTSPSPALGLDYDDGSDSDGSAGGQSPLLKPLQSQLDDEKKNSLGTAANGDIKPNDILEEDLGDVALKMRAKRMREEEEEEGFAGLLGGKAAKDVKPATDTSATSPTIEAITSEPPSPTGDIKGKGEKEGVGKKIKLSLGSLRRFGAGGGVSK